MPAPIPEDDWFSLSAISHYSFCPRRCSLIHSEQIWSENYFTAIGRELHSNVDEGGSESRREKRIVRSLRLFSRELGISGIADAVEFHLDEQNGTSISSWPGKWLPYPIEYKWGTAKNEIPYERQLCAQAICLEEMFHVSISEGALYLGAAKHRKIIQFSSELRQATQSICNDIRNMFASGVTPAAAYAPRCKSCSLFDDCMPKLNSRSARAWLERELENAAQ